MLYICKNAFTTLMPNFCQPVFKFLLHRMHRLCPGRLQNQILLLMQGNNEPRQSGQPSNTIVMCVGSKVYVIRALPRRVPAAFQKAAGVGGVVHFVGVFSRGSSQPVEHRVQPAIDNLLILMEGKVC